MEQESVTIGSQHELNETHAFDILRKVTIPKGDFKTMWSIVYNINGKSISFFTDSHNEIKKINMADMDFSSDFAYINLNQNEIINLDKGLNKLTETINFSYMSPSLIHLGFDERLTKDISQHQFQQNQNPSSVFSDEYFHFEITIPLEVDRTTLFLAVMDSENNFNKRQVVAGGYMHNTIVGTGSIVVPIYGLKNGEYAMLTFIDQNKNRKLDFDKKGNALEKYATFSNNSFKSEREINFASSSSEFSKANAEIKITWKP